MLMRYAKHCVEVGKQLYIPIMQCINVQCILILAHYLNPGQIKTFRNPNTAPLPSMTHLSYKTQLLEALRILHHSFLDFGNR